MFTKYGGYWILGVAILICSLTGTLTWFIHYIATLANTPNQPQAISPIELAGVTATLGGLLLVGAFYKSKNELEDEKEKEVTSDLKTAGKVILFSSTCFVITYFLLEYVSVMKSPPLPSFWFWFYIIMTDIVAIAAGISLSFALSFLVVMVRFV